MRKPGRVKVRLAARLSAALVVHVDPADLWCQEGVYRHADCARWGAHVGKAGRPGLTLFSWETMTECLRAGFMIRPIGDGSWEYEVVALSSLTCPPL